MMTPLSAALLSASALETHSSKKANVIKASIFLMVSFQNFQVSSPTLELTRRRESRRPPPDQVSYEASRYIGTRVQRFVGLRIKSAARVALNQYQLALRSEGS